jgi:hypothetical protein
MRYLFRSIAPTFRAPLLVIVVLLAGCTSPGSDAPAATIAPAPATEVATTAPTTEPSPTNELTPTLVPEAPTVEPETPAAETPVADPPYMDVLCTTVPRPALGLFIPGDDYLFIDPLSGTECDVSLPADMLGPFQAVPHSIFYAQPADGQTMVNRMFTDGVPIPLDFTAVASDESSMHYNFVVSADGSRIA